VRKEKSTVDRATPEPIFDIATGFMAAKHLFIANEVGLFEYLGATPMLLKEE
jgi:hypothetical protein